MGSSGGKCFALGKFQQKKCLVAAGCADSRAGRRVDRKRTRVCVNQPGELWPASTARAARTNVAASDAVPIVMRR